MDPREEKIVDAAFRVISRYGMKRTTMGDIANEAGIARQTLYTVFANKDEVMKGTIRLSTSRAIAAIERETATVEGLGPKVQIIFEHLVIRWYDMLQTMPDAQDLIDGLKGAGQEEIERSYAAYRSLTEGLLAPYAESIAKAGLAPAQVATFVVSSATAAKYAATSREDLLERLAVLTAMLTRLVGEK